MSVMRSKVAERQEAFKELMKIKKNTEQKENFRKIKNSQVEIKNGQDGMKEELKKEMKNSQDEIMEGIK